MRIVTCLAAVLTLWISSAIHASAQGTLADYQRAHELRTRSLDLVVNTRGPSSWIGDSHHFWYPKSVKGGTEFVLVDADRATRKAPFDQDKLANSISTATGHPYTGLKLPFAPTRGRPGAQPMQGDSGATRPLTFLDDERSIQFGTAGSLYKSSLSDYTCIKTGPIPRPDREGRGDAPEDGSQLSPEGPGGDPVDGLEYHPAASLADDEGEFQPKPSGCAPLPPSDAKDSESRSAVRSDPHPGIGSHILGQLPAQPRDICASFDGKYQAYIENFNVFVKPKGDEPAYPVSFDGSENNYYSLETLAWSPDSSKLVAYHTRPGYDRLVTYVESSPSDQIQPKHSTIHYAKPGDPVDTAYPVLFDIVTRQAKEIDRTLFPNPYSISEPVWWKDSRGFTFEYNQRGHQVYTVIEVNAQTARTRPLIREKTDTFFYYNDLGPGLSAGRKYRHDVNDGKEIIWASERDGWEHPYLYDGVTGQVKNQITKGNWLVRNVDWVDDEKRQVWFEAGGSIAGQDPYFTQYYRINFDGTGLTRLTDADATHTVSF